jgi:anti-sigma B factor antagonist
MPGLEPPDLTVVREAQDGIVVVRAEGELDLASAPQLVRAIGLAAASEAMASPQGETGRRPRVLVDLSALEFCDSAGLRALLGAAREVEARAGRLVVAVEPGGAVARLLELAGLTEFLRVRPPAEARAALGLVT